MRIIAIAAALALTACVSEGADPPASADYVEFSAGACFGFCPIFTARVAPDGTTQWSGLRHTGLDETRELQLGPDLFAELAEIIEDNREDLSRGSIEMGHPEICPHASTDAPSHELHFVVGGAAGDVALYSDCSSDIAMSINTSFDAIVSALAAHGAPVRPDEP